MGSPRGSCGRAGRAGGRWGGGTGRAQLRGDAAFRAEPGDDPRDPGGVSVPRGGSWSLAGLGLSPDLAVVAGGEPVWIQRIRELLRLDGLGELAATRGIGGLRMVVLLEGLAGSVPDAEAARVLRSEADARLHAVRAGFVVAPAEPHVTLDDVLADAADFARLYGVDAIAPRFTTAG